MISKYGPAHPVGRAAAAALASAGHDTLAQQALAQYAANQPIRDAAPAGKAWDTAAKHQGNIDAAQETPGGSVGIDAINAAANDLAQRAAATMRQAGGRPQGGSGTPAGDSPALPGSQVAASPVTASSDSTAAPSGPSAQPPASGLMGLSDYLANQALWRGGVLLSPDDLKTGLSRAAGAGALTPAQYETLGQHIAANVPLHHAGGAATAALESVLAHALAAKNGGDVSTPIEGRDNGADSSPATVRDHVKYATGAAARQSTYRTAMRQLTDEGMPEAVQAVADARHESNPETRASILDALDPVQRAKVRALLGAKLYGR